MGFRDLVEALRGIAEALYAISRAIRDMGESKK